MSVPMLIVPLFGVGMTEWLVIGIVVVLLFGASKLPKLGKGLGEGIRNFKRGITGELASDDPPAADPNDDKPKTEITSGEKDA